MLSQVKFLYSLIFTPSLIHDPTSMHFALNIDRVEIKDFTYLLTYLTNNVDFSTSNTAQITAPTRQLSRYAFVTGY